MWSNTPVHADFAVELGKDDPALELPWESPDGAQRYYDLRRRPELLLEIREAHDNRELSEFLVATNSDVSLLETAKCDTWLSNELTEEEAVYGAAWKFGSYIDLVFHEPEPRLSLEDHESLAHRAVKLLKRAPEISAAAEFVIRRCYYHPAPGDGDSDSGFYITFYLYGYGDDEDEARRRWNVGLKLVENALIQLSAQHRREQQART